MGVTKTEESLVKQVSVEEYTNNIANRDGNPQAVIDSNKNKIVDLGDQFVRTGEIVSGYEASRAVESMCRTVAPGKTSFKIDPKVESFVQENGASFTVRDYANSQEATLITANGQVFPMQSFGTFDPTTNSCVYNTGEQKIGIHPSQPSSILLNGQDAYGTTSESINVRTGEYHGERTGKE